MAFRKFLNALFGRKSGASSAGTATVVPGGQPMVPDNPSEPAQICNPKVLLIIVDPLVDAASGRKLSREMNWSRPDDLVGRFIGEVLQASNGLVRYQVAERVELNEFPPLTDSFRYDARTYKDVLDRRVAAHMPSGLDYLSILDQFRVMPRVEAGQIDEVWMMAFPHAGLYESVMGGAGAYWCNAPPLAETATCKRRFVIMGFSFERDVGEMLHSYNHRSEAILARMFDSLEFLAWAYKPTRSPATIPADQQLNLFQRFLAFDQIAPGKAGIGSVHYPPNGVRDYDLGNPRLVASACYDWLRFPDFRGDVRMVSASEWGGGTERTYQRWWMDHLPKTAGRKNGIHNNWWQYIANLDNVMP
jgi:hypothetical protein